MFGLSLNVLNYCSILKCQQSCFVFRNVVLYLIQVQLDLAKRIAIKDVFEISVRSILYNGRIINYGCMLKAERKYRTKLTYFSEAQCKSMDGIAKLLFRNWWLKWFALGSKIYYFDT